MPSTTLVSKRPLELSRSGASRPASLIQLLAAVLPLILFWSAVATDATAQEKDKWVATWTASAQGPYPSGPAVAQPDLRFVFPEPSKGANDQTFRLIVRPDLWGRRMRLRFSNAVGTQPVTLDGTFVGIQAQGGNVVPGTNYPVTHNSGQPRVTIPAGAFVYSDPVDLPFVKGPTGLEVAGRRLAVSFHVVGSSGPMTWHAKAMVNSYVTAPGAGSRGKEENDQAFPFTTTSWYFLDAVDVMAPQDTIVIAAIGDSITDGTASTMSGHDRWSDFLSTRLHAAWGPYVTVVNQGIGANQVLGPAAYRIEEPYMGGPSALQRLERDVLSISGLRLVIWLEGINDFGMGTPPPSVEELFAGLREGTRRLQAKGIKVVVGTLTPSLNTSDGKSHGSPEVHAKRRALNELIRTSGAFDGVVEFEAAVLDPMTGMLRAEFQPAPPDRIHPNRAGYQAMANTINIAMLARLVGRTD